MPAVAFSARHPHDRIARTLLNLNQIGQIGLVPRVCIYFRCADIALAVTDLEKHGLAFTGKPHLIARMDDHDLWMAFFKDPDGHTLALMQEAPKGYEPKA